jgi:hypothetical protein
MNRTVLHKAVLAFSVTNALAATAFAQDVMVTPATGAGFAVKDSSGNVVRFRVDANGELMSTAN